MKIKVYIKKYVGGCLDGHLTVSTYDSTEDCIILGTHEFDFEMPDEKQMAVKEIDLINNQIEVMSEAFWKQKSIMQGRIQSLLAIENNPTGENK